MSEFRKSLNTGRFVWLLLPYVVLAAGSSFLHTCPGHQCVTGVHSCACALPTESSGDTTRILAAGSDYDSGSHAPCAACIWAAGSSAVWVVTAACTHADAVAEALPCDPSSYAFDSTSLVLPRGPPSA